MAAGGPAVVAPLVPNTLNANGLIDINWFKVVVTKCPSGRHQGSAAVVFDRWHGMWDSLPDVFVESAQTATSDVPIQELILKNHRLSNLPSNFASGGNLPKTLVLLNLSWNKFTVLPPVICELVKLKELQMNGNELSSLPNEILSMVELETVHLKQNKFEEFPVELCSLPNLKVINMETNLLQKLPVEIHQLSSLRELYLTSNHLVSIPDTITCLQHLEILHLCDNKLLCLPNDLSGLKSLTQLYVASNRLTALPVSLVTLETIQSVTVGENPIQFPPYKICRKGVLAIKDYLSQHKPSDLSE